MTAAAQARIGHHIPPTAPVPKLFDLSALTPFVDPLPIPAVAKSIGYRSVPGKQGEQAPLLHVPISEFESKIHRDVPATRFWGYGRSVPGVIIEARTGKTLIIDWPNELPTKHFLPIDHNLMGAEKSNPEVRTVVHVHGAKAPPESDGFPEDWYVPGRSRTYYYPNEQDAALLWYHDHAMGINRLNIMAGMVGLYIIRDEYEDALNLPKGEYEIPLVVMDRLIRSDGQLYYPVSQRPEAPWIPEFFGNAILANGKLLPYCDVQARKYRIRILNGSNARTFFLNLSNGAAMYQIGSDQGLLSAPVALKSLTLAPGERADLVIDFAEHLGTPVVLNTGVMPILQFRVARTKVVDTSELRPALRPVERIPESAASRTRQLTLREFDDVLDEPMTHLLDGKRWRDPITENPVLNSTEIWSLLNLTEDAHPIHVHLVRFQILDRRTFDVDHYLLTKEVVFTSEALPPAPNEAGWKDTVQASPGAITRIIAKFEGYSGKYVWHCHILEHEDNEMMRPYKVVTA